MELVDMKIKFDDLFLIPYISDIIHFCWSLPYKHFINKKIWKNYICFFGTKFRCEKAFLSIKFIKNKMRSRLTDPNFKNSLLLLVTKLTPNIKVFRRLKQIKKSKNNISLFVNISKIWHSLTEKPGLLSVENYKIFILK